MNWLDEDKEALVSYDKMKLHVDLSHPRIYVDNVPEKIPLCTNVGKLRGKLKNKVYLMD